MYDCIVNRNQTYQIVNSLFPKENTKIQKLNIKVHYNKPLSHVTFSLSTKTLTTLSHDHMKLLSQTDNINVSHLCYHKIDSRVADGINRGSAVWLSSGTILILSLHNDSILPKSHFILLMVIVTYWFSRKGYGIWSFVLNRPNGYLH